MRDLKGKRMPMKPMKMAEADDELALDMPESDEELGSAEAEDDMLPSMDEESAEAGPLDDVADEDLIAEFKKRGLSLDEEEAMEGEEMPLDEEEMPA